MGNRTCLHCGEPLGSKWTMPRPNKRFCGPTCRKAYSRRGDGAKRALRNIMGDLQTVRLTIKRHPDLSDGYNSELRRLRDEITDILRLRDVETIREEAERSALVGGYRERRGL